MNNPKDFDYENLKNIQILSLNESVEKTFNAWYASVCRWYSRNFFTPLIQVEDFPPERVLKTYYDDIFYKLATSDDEDSQKKLQEEIDKIVYHSTKTEEDITEEEQAQADDDAWYEQELAKLNEELKAKGEPNLIDTGKDSEFVEVEDLPPEFGEDG